MATYLEDSIELALQAIKAGIEQKQELQFFFAGAHAASAVMFLHEHDFTDAARELSERFKDYARNIASALEDRELRKLEVRTQFLSGAENQWRKFEQSHKVGRDGIQTLDHIQTFGGLVGGAADRGILEAREKKSGVELE